MRFSNGISVLIWLSFTLHSSEALNSSGSFSLVINPRVQRKSAAFENKGFFSSSLFLFVQGTPAAWRVMNWWADFIQQNSPYSWSCETGSWLLITWYRSDWASTIYHHALQVTFILCAQVHDHDKTRLKTMWALVNTDVPQNTQIIYWKYTFGTKQICSFWYIICRTRDKSNLNIYFAVDLIAAVHCIFVLVFHQPV